MKIAVVGAGLAGLGIAWQLLDLSQASISLDIFDPLPIGGGTSGIASGLLHPYTGPHAHLTWRGEEMMKETHRLLTAASAYSGKSHVTGKGILRLATTETQVKEFQQNAKIHKECSWFEKEQLQEELTMCTFPEIAGGLYISQGIIIDIKSYLEGLMQSVMRLGAQHHQHAITDPSIFANYDRVIIAMGASSTAFDIFAKLPMTKIKGQSIEIAWPSTLSPLPVALLASCHIIMHPDQKRALIGATFERNFATTEPDLESATKELLTKASALIPALQEAKVLNCKSGVRACPTTHKPLLGRLNERFWFCTGLCAKGLLYHGYLGKCMATALLADDKSSIPEELYHHIELPT